MVWQVVAIGSAFLDAVGNSQTTRSKPVPSVVQSVPDPLPPLVESWGVVPERMSQAVVGLSGFAHDGIFLKFNNLEDQESELLCPPNPVELWDLFLQWYFLLHPKFLHVALSELEGVIVDSLRAVRCCSLVIFRVLGWPGWIFPYLYGYQ